MALWAGAAFLGLVALAAADRRAARAACTTAALLLPIVLYLALICAWSAA